MTKKIFDFQERLKFGNQNEQLFMSIYRQPLQLIKEHYADFRLEDGTIVELKSDSYDHDKTENFFIERYSSIESQKPGSFWQSEPKGVGLFIYFFPSNNCYYEFRDLPKVISKLDDIIKEGKIKPTKVFNKGWTGLGYKIPRKDLEEFWEFYKQEGVSL